MKSEVWRKPQSEISTCTCTCRCINGDSSGGKQDWLAGWPGLETCCPPHPSSPPPPPPPPPHTPPDPGCGTIAVEEGECAVDGDLGR